MIRKLTMLMLALALAFAPSATAQENETKANETDEGQQAWVDDCPPDMMCAYQSPEGEGEPAEPGNDTGEHQDGPTYDGNCGGEVCAYDTPPGALGPEGCIDCMQPPAQDAQAAQDAEAKTVPAAAGALALVGGAVAVALLAGDRRR